MANNWAIVIGINHYDHHPERQLKYAVNDAQLVRDFLSDQGSFDPKHILLCLGDQQFRTSPNYPTSSTLLRLLKRDLAPNRIGEADCLWFFFGGHGVSQNGRDYLLTADSLVEDTELKIALAIDDVIDALRKHQKANIVLILDNCRQIQGSRKLIAGDVGRETIKLAQNRGITTLFSCDYGQYSYELANLGHGAFTHALVEGLKQYTLPGPLEQYLQHRVAELNQRNDQVPRIRVEPASKALQPLLPNAATSADITILIDQAKGAELEERFETAKQLWWQVAQCCPERLQEAQAAIERINRKIVIPQPTPAPRPVPAPTPRSVPLPTPPTDRLESLYNQAQHYINLKEWQKASENLKEITRINPNYRSTRALLARIPQQSNDTQELILPISLFIGGWLLAFMLANSAGLAGAIGGLFTGIACALISQDGKPSAFGNPILEAVVLGLVGAIFGMIIWFGLAHAASGSKLEETLVFFQLICSVVPGGVALFWKRSN